MRPSSPKYLITFSLLISLAAIIAGVYANHSLYWEYMNSSGKNSALFGLNELIYLRRLYLLIPLIPINIWLYIVAKNYPSKRWSIVALCVAFVAGFVLVHRFWRYFV
jgi:hypothetical protein